MGGDLVSFVDQAGIYNLFDKQTSFTINMADYTIVDAVKNFPQGIHSGGRY